VNLFNKAGLKRAGKRKSMIFGILALVNHLLNE
jgi:hypothetical protein